MKLMYFICQSCNKDVNRGSNKKNMRKWRTNTIWSDHGRHERELSNDVWKYENGPLDREIEQSKLVTPISRYSYRWFDEL